MIRLAAEYLFLCVINSLHPTLFINPHGHCVAMCDADSDKPHGCYGDYGQSLTDCFDNRGRSQLCDAYVYEVSFDDYDVLTGANRED